MKLLDKRQYLKLLSGTGVQHQPDETTVRDVLAYAAQVFPEMQLKPRPLKGSDIAAVYRFGRRLLCHVKVYARKAPDTFLIVVVRSGRIEGHILIDLAAEYSKPVLNCVATGYHGVPDKDELERQIREIDPDMDNPFAILTTGDGTYLQTFCEADGFILEYQLVNISSHYEITRRASEDDVVAAMLSYAFGRNEWLDAFKWRRLILD